MKNIPLIETGMQEGSMLTEFLWLANEVSTQC
jgi:hypothetical protein